MKQDKKKLYESIMTSVAKEVKKALNEMKVASEETDRIAKKIWDDNNLEDSINWEPEMWNNNEFDPVCGSVEFEGWRFSTNENSDYVHYWSPDDEEGDILRDI